MGSGLWAGCSSGANGARHEPFEPADADADADVRIAHVTDCYLPRAGGIELQVADLAAHQRAAGHDVTVFTSTEGDGEPGLCRLSRPELPAVLRHFDVVHAHTSLVSPFSWTGAAAGSALGRSTVITMHSVLPPGPAWVARLAHSWRGWNVAWTAVSEVAAAPLRALLPERVVTVLHNGIDPAAWQLPARRVDAVADEVTLVSVMRLARRKRPLALVRVLARVRAELPADLRMRVVLVGDGPQRGEVRRAVRRHGLRPWVRLPGRLTRAQIRALYRHADLYVAPATLESFGIAALEARCASLPVVAMACGGVREFIRDGQEGYLVGSDVEMAQVVTRLLVSPNELATVRAHNASTVPPMTWDRVLDRTMQVYRAEHPVAVRAK